MTRRLDNGRHQINTDKFLLWYECDRLGPETDAEAELVRNSDLLHFA